MNKLLDRYKLKKSTNHTTDGIKMNRGIFPSDIQEIFDIACKSGPLLPEDQAFPASQREDRMSSSISSRDSKFEKAMSEKLQRKAREQKRESRSQREMAELSATTQPSSTQDSYSETGAGTDIDYEYNPPKRSHKERLQSQGTSQPTPPFKAAIKDQNLRGIGRI